jgi:hypothetical protein
VANKFDDIYGRTEDSKARRNARAFGCPEYNDYEEQEYVDWLVMDTIEHPERYGLPTTEEEKEKWLKEREKKKKREKLEMGFMSIIMYIIYIIIFFSWLPIILLFK